MNHDRDTIITCRLINQVLSSDSGIEVPESQLTGAYAADKRKNGGRELASEDVDLIVMGDDGGDIPENLRQLFPRTCRLISEQF